MDNWNYDDENDIYYQIGIVYCTNPETTEYESLGIYVPGKYFDAKENENGTYTCSINKDNQVGNYTSDTAPIVLPINTAGYSAQKAPTSYSSSEVTDYTSNGLIYVNAGCRGRENGDSYSGGAPWGVTDLKAAIRYLRFNSENLQGNTESIFTFGHSGGGAQSALVGVTGDSDLYAPYLESIGAAMVDKNGNPLSDSVLGSMCWCPITNLDTADEAYEWNMGQYSDSGSRANDSWTSTLSEDLATEYANYINEINLKDSNGNTLTLEKSDHGIYTSGSYNEYIKSVIEESLNNFLEDTQFPYTASNGNMGGSMGMGGAPDGGMPTGEAPTMDGSDSKMPGGETPSDLQMGEMPKDMKGGSSGESTTYNTAEEYIESLNSEVEWVEYDSSTNTVKVNNIEGFIKTCKNPTKDVGAFDDLERSQAENDLFGNSESDSLHFDKIMTELFKNNDEKYSQYDDYKSEYISEYENDLSKQDDMNNTIETRVNMYNPVYYLCDYYDGSGSSNGAKYWRINTGITQGDSSLCVESNLALALNQSSNVEKVDFTTVWNQGHTTAERTGDSTTNFINWINECLSS